MGDMYRIESTRNVCRLRDLVDYHAHPNLPKREITARGEGRINNRNLGWQIQRS